MAIYRQIHTTMWQDNWFSELDPADKLFWVYLLTNIKTNQSGVYEYSERQASFDTGLSRKEIAGALQRFREAGRVLYSQDTHEIMIANWMKYNSARSPKVAAVIDRELGDIKSREFELKVIMAAQQYEYPIRAELPPSDTVSDDDGEERIPYGYPIDTVSQPASSPEPASSPAVNQHQQQPSAGKAATNAADAVAAVTANDVREFYQQNIGMIAPLVTTQLLDWCKDLSPELVLEALKRTVESGKEWRFAQGILKNWDKKNIRTIADVEADDVKFDRERAKGTRFGRQQRKEPVPEWAKPDYKAPSGEMSADAKASIAAKRARLDATAND